MGKIIPEPLTKKLLMLLVGTGQAVVDITEFLALPKNYQWLWHQGGKELVNEVKTERLRRQTRKLVGQLHKAGYLQTSILGNRLVAELTAKGVQATLAAKLRQSPLSKNNQFTVVIFDIPESTRMARRELRLLLKQGGFIKLQQSVWVSRADAYFLLVSFVRRLKLNRWVNVFKGTDFLSIPK